MSVTNTIDNIVRDTSKLLQYNFHVSKDKDSNSLTASGTAGYKLKTASSSTAVTALTGTTKYVYEFSSLGGDNSANHSDSYHNDDIHGQPTRIYASQILTELKASDSDIDNSNILPIFIIKDSTLMKDHIATGQNSLIIKKIKIKFEIYNYTSSALNYHTENNNLFKFVISTNSNADAVATFPKTLGTQPTKNTTVLSGATFTSINDMFGFNLKKLHATNSQKKQVLNYDIDLNHHETGITNTNNVILGLKFNSDVTDTNFDGCYTKITSHVHIIDHTKDATHDKF